LISVISHIVPSTRRTTLGDRAFPVAAARAWNDLPPTIMASPSLLTFRQQTKTSLFISFNCTHPFNGPLSGTTQVGWYQKGKTNLDFAEARDSQWQWHQLGRMQVCTSLQTENHASTPPLSFCKPDALPATQPTASKY